MWWQVRTSGGGILGRNKRATFCGFVLLALLYVLFYTNSTANLPGEHAVARVIRDADVEWTPVSHNPAIKRKVRLLNEPGKNEMVDVR
jgi:hypothetical protein